jgi:hypothetical protein
MYRLQPTALDYVKSRVRALDGGRGFPFGHPVAGLHVRHGDKKTDGFREHSFESELNAIRKSPEFAHYSPSMNVSSAAIADNNSSLHEEMIVTNNSNAHSHRKSKRHLRIFVASDDGGVISSAIKMGFLAERPGVSQQSQVSNRGMFATLLSRHELGFNASLEIITDIFLLAHCSTLIGIAASQIFRMAAAMANVTGTLKFAAAMDFDQISKIQHLSRKYAVPFPESFEKS